MYNVHYMMTTFTACCMHREFINFNKCTKLRSVFFFISNGCSNQQPYGITEKTLYFFSDTWTGNGYYTPHFDKSTIYAYLVFKYGRFVTILLSNERPAFYIVLLRRSSFLLFIYHQWREKDKSSLVQEKIPNVVQCSMFIRFRLSHRDTVEIKMN